MNIAQVNTIPIEVWLEKMESVLPVKSYSGGRELAYHSPLRNDDKIPSFMVNLDKNLWIDNGTKDAGSTFELIKHLRSLTARDVLRLVEQSGLYKGGYRRSYRKPYLSGHNQTNSPVGAKNSSGLQVISDTEISHPALKEYLENRKIDSDVAKKFLREVRYKSVNGKLNMFGVGIPAGDGFAVSSRLRAGKGYVGEHISSSHLNADASPTLLIFEGFIDALSFISKYRKYENSAIYILNSANIVETAITDIKTHNYESYRLFMDNDKAGNSATKTFLEAFPSKCVDERSKYQDHADINDMICGTPFKR